MAKKRPTDKKLAAEERVPIPARLRPRPALRDELDKKPEHRVLWVLRSLTPGLNYLTKRYSRRWLRADSIAGLAVAAYLIPQVMAVGGPGCSCLLRGGQARVDFGGCGGFAAASSCWA